MWILANAQVALLNIFFYTETCMLKLPTSATCWLYCLPLKKTARELGICFPFRDYLFLFG